MKDRRAISRALRRLRSTRAAAFLEFCMIAPILVMFCSGIFEFVQLWDAKIMANHAAWTVGRIASVQAGQGDSVTVTKGMKFATAALMSTATMGIGGDAAKAAPGWLSGPLRSDIGILSDRLNLGGADAKMSAVLKDFPTRYLVAIFGEVLGNILYGLFSGPVAVIVDNSINDVRVWWEAALRQCPPAAKMSGILRACHTHGVEDGDRQLRQMGVAQQLVNRTVGGRPVVSVTEGQTSPFILSKGHSLSGDTGLDFPRCLDATSQFDEWRVIRDSGWPPKGAAQRMIRVAVSWPFERAWLYPIFSREKWSGKDPVAVGESIAYPQPTIRNANLRSVGAEEYKSDPVPEIPKEFGDLKDRYVNFLKTAAFAITYRLGHELIGAHDANDKGGSYTHKGLGLMCVKPSQRERIERRFGNHRSPWIWDVEEKYDPTMESSMARDGLCYWMDRAVLPPREKNDPYGLKLDRDNVYEAWRIRDGHYKDYLWCWRSVAVFPKYKDEYDNDIRNGDSERWLFHNLGARRPIFENINDFEKVHANEWFHWGKETGDELTLGGVKAPREREQKLHFRHRKTKTLEDVINRRYEDIYLRSGYKSYRNLGESFALDAEFWNCADNAKYFFDWFKPGRERISTCFDKEKRWSQYKNKADNDNRFYPTVRHVVDSILTDDQKWRFRDQENWLKHWAKFAVEHYDKMIRLLEEEQSELERMVFGGSMPTSDGDIWQFGIDERDVQKDPQKALKNMEEAIRKKKAESMDILYGISDKINGMRGLRVHGCIDFHLPRWAFDGNNDDRGPRHKIVREWLAKSAAVFTDLPNLSWEDHMAKVRDKYDDSQKEEICRKLTDSARDMGTAMSELATYMQQLYNQELEYGLRLGLSAAGAAKRRDERPIEPKKPEEWPPKPAPPAPPSRGTGSDNDALGDGWRLEGSGETRGWKSIKDEGWKP